MLSAADTQRKKIQNTFIMGGPSTGYFRLAEIFCPPRNRKSLIIEDVLGPLGYFRPIEFR